MDKQYRLPRKFAEKWIAALRSGEYKQASEILYNDEGDSYCCLGVACKIEYPLHYLKTKYGEYASVIEKNNEDLMYNLKKIPNELKGNILNNILVDKLIKMNDGGKTFNQIADWIEENVEVYD